MEVITFAVHVHTRLFPPRGKRTIAGRRRIVPRSAPKMQLVLASPCPALVWVIVPQVGRVAVAARAAGATCIMSQGSQMARSLIPWIRIESVILHLGLTQFLRMGSYAPCWQLEFIKGT